MTSAGQALACAVALLGTIVLSSRTGLAPERALALSGGLAIVVAAAFGFAAAAWARKVGFFEIFISGLVFTGASSALITSVLRSPFGLIRPVLSDIAYLAAMLGSNPLGGIALAAVVIWGSTFVGASLGFLLAGTGTFDLRFSYESFIARSHLRMRKKSPTMIMTIISICGVAVGVLALTVVLSVMSGFELDLKNKIIGTNAHAVVLKYGTDFKEWRDVAEQVHRVRGVTGVTPFILNEVMVSSEQNISGAVIKGIDPETVDQVASLKGNMKEGRLEWLDHPEKIPTFPSGGRTRSSMGLGEGSDDEDASSVRPKGPAVGDSPNAKAAERPAGAAAAKRQGRPEASSGSLSEEQIIGAPKAADADGAGTLPGIVLGKELAHSMKVMVGDRVNVVSPLGGELGPTGPMPKSRPFKVAGIFFSGMYEYDAKFAYIALPEAQKFFGLGASVTGLELKTDDIDNTRQITRQILQTLDGYPYRTKDWGEMNRNLFSALRLEKLVMAVILGFIVLVACFNIVSTLIMMVLEKGKEIATLKSMGATDTSVMKVFVLEGLMIGLLGTAVGLVLGYLACLVVDKVGIHLDAEVYYIDKLPVKIDALQFAGVAFLAILLSYLATIYPATRASRLAPVDGLRNE